MSGSGCFKLRKKARERGWRAGTSMIVQVQHVDDEKRSGRPGASQKIVDLILLTVTRNSTTRGWSSARIASEIYNIPGITPKEAPSASTVYRTLRKNRYHVYKRTVKLGLNKKQKEARLAWCLLYKDWTLED